jgi:hypothetical protein
MRVNCIGTSPWAQACLILATRWAPTRRPRWVGFWQPIASQARLSSSVTMTTSLHLAIHANLNVNLNPNATVVLMVLVAQPRHSEIATDPKSEDRIMNMNISIRQPLPVAYLPPTHCATHAPAWCSAPAPQPCALHPTFYTTTLHKTAQRRPSPPSPTINPSDLHLP